MPNPVIDLGSNLEENLKRWATALKAGGGKLQVFKAIYSGKRRRWTALEISKALMGTLSTKRVTEWGKKLDGDGLIRQVPDEWPVVYEKLSNVHHYKRRILRLAADRLKRANLPTKRQSQLRVTIGRATSHSYNAREITIDDIDQFSRVRLLSKTRDLLPPIPERRFKAALKKLFQDSGRFPDWGGERDDFFTNKLRMKGKRLSAAFALKGPGVRRKVMTPGKWGKQGNQIQRLLEAPASVFILQFEGQIDESSIDQLKKLTEHKSAQEGRRLYFGYIERDDSLRLRKAYPKAF